MTIDPLFWRGYPDHFGKDDPLKQKVIEDLEELGLPLPPEWTKERVEWQP